MGYYTRFELTLDCDKIIEGNIQDYMEDNEDKYYGILGDDEYKWYDYEDEMRKLSLEFPEVLFRLDGDGEGQGDVWVKYFKNGKMQECNTVCTLDDTFDESKLC